MQNISHIKGQSMYIKESLVVKKILLFRGGEWSKKYKQSQQENLHKCLLNEKMPNFTHNKRNAK